MDRPIDAAVTRRKGRRRRALALGGVAAVSCAFAWAPSLLRPSVRRSALRTAVVDEGPLEAAISASGTVLPEVEKALSSPADARVLRILKRAGSTVKKGDALVELDLGEQILEKERLRQRLALKRNEQKQARLSLEEKLIGLRSQSAIKDLQLQVLREQLSRDQSLYAEGLVSRETLRQAELTAAQAGLELRKLGEERDNAQRQAALQAEGLALEMATVDKERAQAAHQLELATALADRDGVVTWTLSEEGAAVHKGDVIARVADLSSYRVDATVSDVHAAAVAIGMPVAVRVGAETLDGTVARVAPTVQNGVITVSVALRESASPLLRPNLRVDVFLVTARKEHALRLPRGPFLNGAGKQDVFVVRGDRARRVPAEIGIVGLDRCEAAAGLHKGDEVIVSDMRDYAHAAELVLR